MKAHLQSDGYQFRSLFETVVTSPQFLNQRVREKRELQAQLQPRKAN
jgi:hypothetical protein